MLLSISEKTFITAIYGKTSNSIESITQNKIEDRKTYALLSAGYTQNIFQFSSPCIIRFLMDVAPDSIEDLIAAGALYRPATAVRKPKRRKY
jgi:DNA polymerase III alpha subunit